MMERPRTLSKELLRPRIPLKGKHGAAMLLTKRFWKDIEGNTLLQGGTFAKHPESS